MEAIVTQPRDTGAAMKATLYQVVRAVRASAGNLVLSVLLVAGAAGVAMLLPVAPSPTLTVAQAAAPGHAVVR
jgi:hypothetical protein